MNLPDLPDLSAPENPKRTGWIVVGVVLLLLVISLLRGGPAGRNTSGTPTTKASRCQPVNASDMGNLSAGMEDGFIIRGALSVESNDYGDVDFVAAEIEGPGAEGDGHIGVWAVGGSLANPSAIMSINGLADEYSVWLLGSSTTYNVTMGDDGASEVRNCLA